MRTFATARSSRLQTGALQLGASLRGMIYGFAVIVAAPMAWTVGKALPALFIAAMALLCIGVEAVIHGRGDQAR
jgi:hypothetical protein